MFDVFVDYDFEMSTTEDEYPIQTLTSDGQHETFSEGIGTKCPDRSPDDPDVLGTKDFIEAGG